MSSSNIAGGQPNNKWLIKKNNVEDQNFSDFRGDSSVLTTTFQTIWGEASIYTFPTVGSQMTISSASANDTDGGTGQTLVLLIFLDSNYVEHQELIVMNGQTPVNTVSTDVYRINYCWGVSAGSNQINEGIIYVGTGTVTAGKPANVYSHMRAEFGYASNGVYSVPVHQSWSDLTLMISAATGKIIQTRTVGFNAFGTGAKNIFFEAKDLVDFTAVDLSHFNAVPGKLDLRIDARVTQGVGECSFLYNFLQFKMHQE